jgi:hypothetical protein
MNRTYGSTRNDLLRLSSLKNDYALRVTEMPAIELDAGPPSVDRIFHPYTVRVKNRGHWSISEVGFGV